MSGTLDSLAALHADRAASYWTAAAEIAAGDKVDAAEVDDLLRATGRTAADLELDTDLLRQLAAVEPASATLDDLRAAVAASKKATRAAETEADALAAKARGLRDRAAAAARDARARRDRAEAAAAEAHRLRRQLADRGHAGAAAEADRVDEQQRRKLRREQLEAGLRNLEPELADVRRAVPHASPDVRPQVQAELDRLERTQAGLISELAALDALETAP